MRPWIKYTLATAVMALLSILLVPIPDEDLGQSLVLYDAERNLLCARIAADEQWRIPLDGDLPEILSTSIRLFEDEYFHYHPGVNPVSIVKAMMANAKAGKIVRGGSTLSMQVMRMYRGN